MRHQLNPDGKPCCPCVQAVQSDGSAIFLEQISHHPPISAFQMIGPGATTEECSLTCLQATWICIPQPLPCSVAVDGDRRTANGVACLLLMAMYGCTDTAGRKRWRQLLVMV